MKKSHWWFFLRCCPNENHGRKTCLGLDFFISLVALGLVWTSQSSILEVVATSLVMKQCSNVLSLKCSFFKINHKILPKQNSALAEIWSRIRITSFIWHLFLRGCITIRCWMWKFNQHIHGFFLPGQIGSSPNFTQDRLVRKAFLQVSLFGWSRHHL